MKKNKKRAFKVPFYAHLLTQQEMHNAAAGATSPVRDQPMETHKWPSDSDESTPLNDSVDS